MADDEDCINFGEPVSANWKKKCKHLPFLFRKGFRNNVTEMTH